MQDDSEVIEKINVKPQDAFGRFKGKEISTGSTGKLNYIFHLISMNLNNIS